MARTELAKRAGVSLTSLNLIEAGRIAASLRTLEAVARTLRVPIRDLFDEEAPVPQASGSKTLFRISAKLRERDERYLRAVEKLMNTLDGILEDQEG